MCRNYTSGKGKHPIAISAGSIVPTRVGSMVPAHGKCNAIS